MVIASGGSFLISRPAGGKEWSLLAFDPTPGACIAILVYLLTGYFCLRASVNLLRKRPEKPKTWAQSLRLCGGKVWRAIRRKEALCSLSRTAILWILVSGCMGALALSRVADVGNLLTALGRQTSRNWGWYAQRRPVQVATILALVAAAAGTSWVLSRTLRQEPGELRVALVGTLFVLGLVGVRAISWHYMDLALGSEWRGIRLSWVLEIGGASTVLGAAVWSVGRSETRPTE